MDVRRLVCVCVFSPFVVFLFVQQTNLSNGRRGVHGGGLSFVYLIPFSPLYTLHTFALHLEEEEKEKKESCIVSSQSETKAHTHTHIREGAREREKEYEQENREEESPLYPLRQIKISARCYKMSERMPEMDAMLNLFLSFFSFFFRSMSNDFYPLFKAMKDKSFF